LTLTQESKSRINAPNRVSDNDQLDKRLCLTLVEVSTCLVFNKCETYRFMVGASLRRTRALWRQLWIHNNEKLFQKKARRPIQLLYNRIISRHRVNAIITTNWLYIDWRRL